MFVTIRKWTAIYIASLAVLFCLFAVIMSYGESIPTSGTEAIGESIPVLIIDAGHGGEDGGAIGADGTIESDINLEIAFKASEIARLMGWNICMTRCEDISIHDPEADTLREKKVSDLKNRVTFCNGITNGFLISIHQNSMPNARNVQGAQVFFYNEATSREVAAALQNALNQHINTGREKEVKNIGDSSYLMRSVTCPAILVECGFLSNDQECCLLNSEEHQLKIALLIINSVTKALGN